MPCKSSSPAEPGLLGTKPDLGKKAKCMCVCWLHGARVYRAYRTQRWWDQTGSAVYSKPDLLKKNEVVSGKETVAWGRTRGPSLGIDHCLPGKHAWVPETQRQRLGKSEAGDGKGENGYRGRQPGTSLDKLGLQFASFPLYS